MARWIRTPSGRPCFETQGRAPTAAPVVVYHGQAAAGPIFDMKRKKPLQRRTWMKRQSDAKRKEKRDTDGPRRNYRLEFPTCQCCERRRSRHTHEIASGGARANAVYFRAAWLAVCMACHREIHETPDWPVSRQLYQKWKHDRKFYCRRTVNRLRGRDEEAITQEEVDAWSPNA